MEGRRGEDRVDGLVQLELEQVLHADVGLLAESAPCRLHHRGRLVDGDHAAAGQPLTQRLGDPSGPAARVEHDLLAGQLEPLEHLQPERLHGPGYAVVAGPVPLAY